MTSYNAFFLFPKVAIFQAFKTVLNVHMKLKIGVAVQIIASQ